MTSPVAMPDRGRLPIRPRVAALLAVGAARVLSAQPPRRIRSVLRLLRRGARPATVAETRAARRAVVTVSNLCAGEGCLPRSIATALLCRLRGSWPQSSWRHAGKRGATRGRDGRCGSRCWPTSTATCRRTPLIRGGFTAPRRAGYGYQGPAGSTARGGFR